MAQDIYSAYRVGREQSSQQRAMIVYCVGINIPPMIYEQLDNHNADARRQPPMQSDSPTNKVTLPVELYNPENSRAKNSTKSLMLESGTF